jgi:molybdopterin converting factor subunit 1
MQQRVTVLYFAAIRELLGQHEESLVLSSTGVSVQEFLEELTSLHPGLRGRLGGVRVAVNEAFVSTDAVIHAGDVVALIPPVTGG